MNGFLGAVQFLTRIPIRLRTAPVLGVSVPWFPVVGALIGLTLGLVAAGLWELVPATVAASVTILAGVLLTGALHEDGLADTADAFGGATPSRRREILKDSRHGSYGVAAMVGTIVLRIACVATLTPAAAVAGLVSAHALGRAGAVVVMTTSRPATTTGLGADYLRDLRRAPAIVGVLAGIAVTAVATGWWVLPIAAAVAVGASAVAIVTSRAFEGVTGDALGAVEQVGECLALVVVSGVAARHTVWWA